MFIMKIKTDQCVAEVKGLMITLGWRSIWITGAISIVLIFIATDKSLSIYMTY